MSAEKELTQAKSRRSDALSTVRDAQFLWDGPMKNYPSWGNDPAGPLQVPFQRPFRTLLADGFHCPLESLYVQLD